MKRAEIVAITGWGITAFVTLLAIVAWGQTFDWQFGDLSTYLIFPLLGLLAFSLMWTHYIIGSIRRLAGVSKSAIQTQLTVTGYAVLALILSHPGLLIWQLWRDGRGLPPESYLKYVATSLKGAVILGSVSLVVFLAYELRPWFHSRRWWKAVVIAGDAAMFAIFWHALKLGSQTQLGWYHTVWLMYGVLLVGSLSFNYHSDRQHAKRKE